MTYETTTIEVKATQYGEVPKPTVSESPSKESLATESLDDTEPESLEGEGEDSFQSTTPPRPSSIEVDLDAALDESVAGDDEATKLRHEEGVPAKETEEVETELGIKRTSSKDAGMTTDAADEQKDAQKSNPRRKNFVLEWRTTKEVNESVSSQEAIEVAKEFSSVAASQSSRSTNSSKSRRSSQSIREKAAKIKAALSKRTPAKKGISEEERIEPKNFEAAASKIALSFEEKQNKKELVALDDKMETGKFKAMAEKLALSLKPKVRLPKTEVPEDKEMETHPQEIESRPTSPAYSTKRSISKLVTAIEVNLNEKTLKGYESEPETELFADEEDAVEVNLDEKSLKGSDPVLEREPSDEEKQEDEKKEGRKVDESTSIHTGAIATITSKNTEDTLNTKDAETSVCATHATPDMEPITNDPSNSTGDVLAADGMEIPVCTGNGETPWSTEIFDQVQSTVEIALRDVCFETSVERTLSMDTEHVHHEEAKHKEDAAANTEKSTEDNEEHMSEANEDHDQIVPDALIKDTTSPMYEMPVAPTLVLGNQTRGMSMLESVNSETGSVTMLSENDPRAASPEPVEMNHCNEVASVAHETEKISEQEASDLNSRGFVLPVKET
eukprot:scaffold137_cov111-Amphora_coffeaeformis.AAC.1